MPLRNIMGVVEYDGTDFEGFQVQPENHRSVQGELIKVLQKILNHPVKVKGASRTDAGVHASGQVISFKTSASRTLTDIKSGVNKLSGSDVRLVELAETDWDFHPRFNAKGKVYLYIIDKTESVLRSRFSWGIPGELDIDMMIRASGLFIGEHDFQSFTTSGSHRGENTIRRIDSVEIQDPGDLIKIEISGSGFLYQMVRRMVKALVNIGNGSISMEEFEKFLVEPEFEITGSAAPSKGLILREVKY
jgi:tRNA pseudouridine38-40 synthase